MTRSARASQAGSRRAGTTAGRPRWWSSRRPFWPSRARSREPHGRGRPDPARPEAGEPSDAAVPRPRRGTGWQTGDARSTSMPEARRQRPPGTAGHQDVDDRGKAASSSMSATPPPCGRTRAGGSDGLATSRKPSGTIHPHRPLPMSSTSADWPHRRRRKQYRRQNSHNKGGVRGGQDADVEQNPAAGRPQPARRHTPSSRASHLLEPGHRRHVPGASASTHRPA